MKTNIKILIGAVLVAALIALGFFLYKPAEAPEVPEAQGNATPQAPIDSPEPGTPEGLPAEPAFQLPAGATAIDDYVFVQNGQVFVRSLTNPEPLAIPGALANSFEGLTSFMVSSDLRVVASCGAAGSYKFYGDEKNLYFYQYWRAPEFRSSKFERVADSDPAAFKRVTDTSFMDGNRTIEVSFQKATTTCSYVLSSK